MNESNSSFKDPNAKRLDYEEGEIPSDADDFSDKEEGMHVTPGRFDGNGRS